MSRERFTGIQVRVDGGDIERAIRKLGRMVRDQRILKEVAERGHFTKPSQKRRQKSSRARRRASANGSK